MVLKKIPLFAVMLVIFIAGCTTENTTSDADMQVSNGEDNFRLLVSDAPADIADFDYLDVQISKARIFHKNRNSFEEMNVNRSVDITKLVGEVSTEVLSTYLPPGNYTKVELYVESTNAMANNQTANIMVPSEKLQITKPFEVVEGEVTSFVFDINVVKKGPGNEYNLLPVISESGVIGKDLEKSEIREIEKEGVGREENNTGVDII